MRSWKKIVIGLFAMMACGTLSAQMEDMSGKEMEADEILEQEVLENVGNEPKEGSLVVVNLDTMERGAEKQEWKPNPKTALYLSLVPCAGLGQIYNKKYWKLPIVYGGYAALIYGIIYNGKKHNEYKRAYVSIADGDDNTNAWQSKIPNGQTTETVDMQWLTSSLQTRYIRFRRYRDYCILGTVAMYALTMLDAYVDAQLFDFDISNDLSLHWEPEIDMREGFWGNGLAMRCSLIF